MNHVFRDAVIDGEWKPLGETAVITIDDLMDSTAPEKRINIQEQAVQKVCPKTSFPAFIESKTLDQIILGFNQDLDSHETLFRISALAVSQSTN